MRQSVLFTKTLKKEPFEESVNAKLLIKGGFIDKLMSGVYTFLPLGLRTLNKIENIIREAMNEIGGQEILMPALHPKHLWEKTGRWKYKEMFKLKSRSEKDFALGWTHEEIITPLVKKFINSSKDLPLFVYQIQEKFRDELRSKSGILRGIEFIMKDLYSFHKSQEDLDKFYEKVKKAYFKIFKNCGIEKETFLTYASGGAFSKYSHEFQTVTPFGEDEIYLCPKCRIAVNKEIVTELNSSCPICKNKNLEIKKSIETGNIFKLGDKYSKPFDLKFFDEKGKENFIIMGCYGIGLTRLMGAIVEIFHDEKGIIWPRKVAPYTVHLLTIGKEKNVLLAGEKLYNKMIENKIEVLYDDRENKTAGEKFFDADLIGLPFRVVVSAKTLKENCVELKERSSKKISLIKNKILFNLLLQKNV